MHNETRTAPELLIATLLLTGMLATVEAAAAPLQVTIDDVRSTDGRIMVQIVDSQAGFDGGAEPVAAMLIEPVTPRVEFSVDLEPTVAWPVGKTCSQPAPCDSVAVTFNSAAVDPEGTTPPPSAIWNSRVSPAASATPARVSASRVGVTAT